MNWTTDKPTTPGFYWFKGTVLGKDYDKPVIMEVQATGSGLVVWQQYMDYADPLGEHVGEWAGPIEPPKAAWGKVERQGRVFEIHREVIDVTSMMEPDPSWVYIDLNGHEHRWNNESEIPSVKTIEVREPVDDDDPGEYETRCAECSALVDLQGSTRPSTGKRFASGPFLLFIDGERVDKETFTREYEREHGRSPWESDQGKGGESG